MAGKLINLRLGEKLLKEIDLVVKTETYESRTEFIKATLRNAIEERKKEHLLNTLRKEAGNSRLGLQDLPKEEFEEIQSEAGKKPLKTQGVS